MHPRLLTALILCLLLCNCVDDEDGPVPRIGLSAEIVPASNFGARDGRIDLAVSGGRAPYVYQWNTGSAEEDQTDLGAGTYAVTVVDAASAVAEGKFTVAQPAAVPLQLTFAATDASAYNRPDATVSLTVSGGSPPYTYQWSNGTTEANLTDVRAGTYRITVTDAGNPPVVTLDSVTVGEPAFVCGRDSIADVDGNLYATVDLGGQCWTASNLRTRNQPKAPAEALAGRFCAGQNCGNARGAHYEWTTAQDACPCEWHLPTVAEWNQLATWLSTDGNGGPGPVGPNKVRGNGSTSGLDVLYAGNWGFPLFGGEFAAFWTASPTVSSRATYRLITPTLPIFGGGEAAVNLGLSVRCVRDR